MNLEELTTQPAVFSHDRLYRYSLRRDIGGKGPPVLFIMLNPSTADETQDDPTIRRCMGYATTWGANVLYIANIFALRSTDPKAMKRHPEPIGGDTNWVAILGLATYVHDRGGKVVAAWGRDGKHMGRGEWVRNRFRTLAEVRREETFRKPYVLHHLGLTKEGHPRHPLYLRKDLVPEVWQ